MGDTYSLLLIEAMSYFFWALNLTQGAAKGAQRIRWMELWTKHPLHQRPQVESRRIEAWRSGEPLWAVWASCWHFFWSEKWSIFQTSELGKDVIPRWLIHVGSEHDTNQSKSLLFLCLTNGKLHTQTDHTVTKLETSCPIVEGGPSHKLLYKTIYIYIPHKTIDIQVIRDSLQLIDDTNHTNFVILNLSGLSPLLWQNPTVGSHNDLGMALASNYLNRSDFAPRISNVDLRCQRTASIIWICLAYIMLHISYLIMDKFHVYIYIYMDKYKVW